MNSNAQTQGQPKADPKAHAHPTAATFWKTFVMLFVVTAIEFGIVYIEGIRPVVLTVLVALSVLKFWYVASIFMHLKFDHKILGWVFAVGVVLAGLITLALKFINLA